MRLLGDNRKKRHLGILSLGLLFFSIMLAAVIPVTAAEVLLQDPQTLDELMKRVKKNLALPSEMGFSQEIEAKGLIGHWRFSSVVVRSNSGLSVRAEGAPAFISEELLADLADFEKAMAQFDLKYSGRKVHEGLQCFWVTGVRRAGISRGAREGSICIDPSTYGISWLEARYSWGRVSVNHFYSRQGSYTVLERQEAQVWPLFVHLTIKYSDYWFSEPD